MSDQLRSAFVCRTGFDSADRSAFAHQAPSAGSKTLADILGYHYYTELGHSAGMPREQIEEPGLDPKEKVGRLVARMEPLRQHDSVQLADRDGAGVLRLSADEHLTPAQLGIALRCGREENGRAGLGAATCSSAAKLEAVFLDQQFRRSADGLRHQALCPLPADRRSGVSSRQARSARAAAEARRASTSHNASIAAGGDRQAVRRIS